MSNSVLKKNGIDKLGTHCFQYTALVVSTFAIYFGWAFFNDISFRHFAVKIFKFWNSKGYNPLDYYVICCKGEFYP